MPADLSSIDLATLNTAQCAIVAAIRQRCCQSGPINGLSPEALIPVSAWGFVGKFRS
jgi:hypothetical protein